jgi:hypothetical protein
MSQLAIRRYQTEDEGKILPLLNVYPYDDLRRYRIINKERQTAYLRLRIARCASDGSVWVSEANGKVRALVAVRMLPWDSSIFGVKMGQIPILVHEGLPEDSREFLKSLLDSVLGDCRKEGMRHLNIRVDADNLMLAQVLEEKGFYLVDTIVTYIFNPRRQELPHIKQLYKTRVYREEDHDAVLQVAAVAYKNFIGRYHADPHLPNDLCDKLYRLWAKRILDGDIAEQIIVAERKGKVIGFLGYRLKQDILEATGVRVAGGGLGGCLPDGFGAYAAILETAMREGMHRYDMQDFETQINNVNIILIYQKLNFEYTRAQYTFHAWL